MQSQHYAIGWSDLHRDTRTLSRTIMASGKTFQGIVALARGGLVPAAIVARELNIRKIETLCIQSYDDKTQGELDVLKLPEQALEARGAGWLVIDDLIDSGTTIREAHRLLPQAMFATLYVKCEPQGLVDYYVSAFNQDTWLFFPWDTEAAYATPLIDQPNDT